MLLSRRRDAARWLRLLVLLLGCSLSAMSHNQKRRRKRTNPRQEMYSKRMACEMECLAHWVPEEAMNCIYGCRSPTCFDKVYGEDLLEPGQVDIDRADTFDKCNINEILETRNKERQDRKEQKNNQREDDESMPEDA